MPVPVLSHGPRMQKVKTQTALREVHSETGSGREKRYVPRCVALGSLWYYGLCALRLR